MNIIRTIYRRTEQFISTSMCAQEVMNIEEQCAEHFLLQNDRSADQIQNIFGLRVKLIQNKFKISVMGLENESV